MNTKTHNKKCSKTQIEGRYALYSGGDCICTFEEFPDAEKAFYKELDTNPTSYVSLFSTDHKTNYLSYNPINGEMTRTNIPNPFHIQTTMTKKNTTKRLMDVQEGDKLYIITKNAPYDGIEEVTVTQTGNDEHSVESWFIYDDHVSRTYIPRSSMKKYSMGTYDQYIGTSRAEVLKAAAKLLVKSMEKTTKAIGDLSDRLVALRDTQAKLTRLMEEYGRSV